MTGLLPSLSQFPFSFFDVLTYFLTAHALSLLLQRVVETDNTLSQRLLDE